jgi:hypothetical protein
VKKRIIKYTLPFAKIFVLLLISFFSKAQNINEAEYFFDTDPGVGNGFPLTVGTAADSVSFTGSINTTGLATGQHFLFIRTRNTNGIWSLYEHQSFYIKNSIVKAEYFFDTDPGVGNGTNIPVTATLDSLTFTSTISTTGLTPGLHFLFVRTKDEKGVWSHYQHSQFFVKQSITKAEYFFDTDPGVGNGTSIPVTAALDSITFTNSINTTGLSEGSHFLFVRTRDNNGIWSLYQPREFYIKIQIEAAEFFIDTDPGVGNGTPVTVPVYADSVSFLSNIVTPLSLTNGNHYLFIRTRDSKRIWSLYEPVLFTVDITLPVEWLTFTAEKENEKALLNWSTASETNCDRFEIERTTDEQFFDESNFIKTGEVAGHGNSAVSNNYSFTDEKIDYKGFYYYRLKQIDTDGNFNYSDIRVVDFSKNYTMKLYPNPGNDFFTLELEGNINDDAAMNVYDSFGKLIFEDKLTENSYRFGGDWSTGIYFVHIVLNNEETIFKLIKTN